jgi:holo-[acyl-carrier protein] synthase
VTRRVPQATTQLGIDLVNVAEVRRSLDRFGARFVRRVFTPAEVEYCESRPLPARVESYAARFAAKEAVMKVLGVPDLAFTDIEIARCPTGELAVSLGGSAEEAADRRGLAAVSVSVSHEGDHAVAVALGWFGGVATREPAELGECRVALLEESAVPRIQQVIDLERAKAGRPRQITRVVATSAAVWQLTTRATALYTTLRRIDRQLIDLLCLYTALLNGCRYCADDGIGEALGHGWSVADLLALGVGDTGSFPPPVCAALRYAAALSLRPHDIDLEFAELANHYDDEAVLEITTVVALKNFWTRFATGLRIPAEGKCADDALLEELWRRSERLRDPRKDCRNAG